MGMTKTIYIGPYIVIEHKTAYKEASKLGCLKDGCVLQASAERCSAHESVVFCQACGSKMGVFEYSVDEKAWLHDIIVDQFEESLYYAGDHDILVPNRDIDGRLSHHDKHDEDGVHEIKEDQELNWFFKEYKEEMDALEAACKSFEVRFGIVTYVS